MLALRRLAAAHGHETRPLAAALASNAPSHIPQPSISLQPSLPSTPSPSLASALHPRSSSSSRSAQHQRRHSSSKPSSPPSDDAIANTGGGSGANASASAGAGTRTGARAGVPAEKHTRKRERRKEREVTKSVVGRGDVQPMPAKELRALPTVPATEHLDSQAVNLASFFSLHRPISVTSPVPNATNAQSFASLFQPASPGRRVNDTLLTLASAVRVFDQAIDQHSGRGEPQVSGGDSHRHQALQQQAPSAEAEEGQTVYVSVQDLLSRGLRPFHPPPPPLPPQLRAVPPATDIEPVAQAEQVDRAVHALRQSTVLAALRGRVAERQRIVQQTYAGRMLARRTRYASSISAEKGTIWQALSTRRRRELKMKKHKFKKLLKRQKNEKRRQDRL